MKATTEAEVKELVGPYPKMMKKKPYLDDNKNYSEMIHYFNSNLTRQGVITAESPFVKDTVYVPITPDSSPPIIPGPSIWMPSLYVAVGNAYQLAVCADKLYFAWSGNVTYVYDGVSWGTTVSGGSDFLLCEYGGKLYGGASGTVKEYDPSTDTWATSYTFPVSNTKARSMTVHDGSLYVSTTNTQDGLARIYKFDGSSWSLLTDAYIGNYWPSSDIFQCNPLCSYNGDLYAGFGQSYVKIYKYDGNAWSLSYSGGARYYVHSMCVYNNKLYVSMGNGLYSFDGSNWALVGNTSMLFTQLVSGGLLWTPFCTSSSGGGDIQTYDGSAFQTNPYTYPYTAAQYYFGMAEYDGYMYLSALGSEADVYRAPVL